MTVSIEELETILKIFEESGFDELTLEFSGGRLEVKRGGAGSTQVISERVSTASSPAPTATPSETTKETQNTAPPAGPETAPGNADWIAIRSEISGTYYDSPSPTEEPFVAVGTQVAASDTVCMVEVMKLFTSVTAGVDAKVVEIVATNGSPVSPGDVLLYLQPIT